MAELQRLLQSINGQNKTNFLPANFFNLKTEPNNEQQQQQQQIQQQVGANNGTAVSNDNGFSGFSGADTPSSMSSQSPAASSFKGSSPGSMVIKTEPQDPMLMNGQQTSPMANGHSPNSLMYTEDIMMQDHSPQQQQQQHQQHHQSQPQPSFQHELPQQQPLHIPQQQAQPQQQGPPPPHLHQQQQLQQQQQQQAAAAQFAMNGIEEAVMNGMRTPISPLASSSNPGSVAPAPRPLPQILAGIVTPPQSQTPQPNNNVPYSETGMSTSNSPYPDSAPSPLNLDTLLDEARQPPTPDRKELIDQVVDTVIEAHMITCNYTTEKVKTGIENFIANHSNGPPPGSEMAMKMMMGGPGKMWEQFVANMVPVITRVVKFCKRLPGFMELTEADQIRLIKQGSFEVVLLRYTPLFQEDGMFIPSMEMKIPRHVVKTMPMGSFFEQQFQFANQFNQLQLTDGEVGILTAALILNPTRMGLTNKKAVQKLQGLFFQSLYCYMRMHRGDMCDSIFVDVLRLLPLLHVINEEHCKTLNSMKMTMPDVVKPMPELHQEVYDGQM